MNSSAVVHELDFFKKNGYIWSIMKLRLPACHDVCKQTHTTWQPYDTDEYQRNIGNSY